jgi:flagellin
MIKGTCFMSSILTNNSAMVALQTLKSINMNLGKVQNEISTGKTVESAKDNAAVWAISKVMSSDVKGFEAISDALALGQATIGVAINGAETISDLLTEVKGKIVNSQESNVDRAKIQTDIEALTNQIKSIVGAAQFNGLNLFNGADTANVEILSSLDRAADGSVTAGQISVARTNLNGKAVLADNTAVAGGANGGAAAATVAGAANANFAIVASDGVTATGDPEGVAYSIVMSAGGGALLAATEPAYTSGTATTSSAITYVGKAGDTAADIGVGLAAAWDVYVVENGLDASLMQVTAVAGGINVAVAAGTGNTINVQVNANKADSATAPHKAAGEMAMLEALDVTTEEGANTALTKIETLIQTAIDTAARLGSNSKQIDTQAEFVGKLSDLLTSGIGSLVDADMEAASAKLQALQTQQQLGVQALSIANQAPQTILSLFR